MVADGDVIGPKGGTWGWGWTSNVRKVQEEAPCETYTFENGCSRALKDLTRLKNSYTLSVFNSFQPGIDSIICSKGKAVGKFGNIQ